LSGWIAELSASAVLPVRDQDLIRTAHESSGLTLSLRRSLRCLLSLARHGVCSLLVDFAAKPPHSLTLLSGGARVSQDPDLVAVHSGDGRQLVGSPGTEDGECIHGGLVARGPQAVGNLGERFRQRHAIDPHIPILEPRSCCRLFRPKVIAWRDGSEAASESPVLTPTKY
jgi:hypothetical protein